MIGHRYTSRASARARKAARRSAFAGIVFAGASLGAIDAKAQSRLSLDVSASGGVSTNPYQSAGSSSAAVTGTLDAHPTLVIDRPLTTLTLSGDANVAFYGRDYGTNESFSLDGAINHKLSAQTAVYGSISYLNSIVGAYTDVRVPVGQPVVENNLPVYVNDPALGGIGRRRQSYQGALGLNSLLSPVDRVGVSVSASANRFGGLALADYNYYAPSASYSRALGPSFNVGVSMSVGFTDYLGTRIGDATIYQPSLTMSRLIAKAWTLSAAAGAAISTVRDASGANFSSTTFNGTLNLCRNDDRRNICLGASRQTLPSSFQGVRTQTALTASIGYRASARDDVSVSASYSRAGDPVQRTVLGGVRSGSTDYLSASGNLSHLFRPAWRGFVSAGYSKIFDDFQRRGGNITAQLGVSYRFGR